MPFFACVLKIYQYFVCHSHLAQEDTLSNLSSRIRQLIFRLFFCPSVSWYGPHLTVSLIFPFMFWRIAKVTGQYPTGLRASLRLKKINIEQGLRSLVSKLFWWSSKESWFQSSKAQLPKYFESLISLYATETMLSISLHKHSMQSPCRKFYMKQQNQLFRIYWFVGAKFDAFKHGEMTFYVKLHNLWAEYCWQVRNELVIAFGSVRQRIHVCPSTATWFSRLNMLASGTRLTGLIIGAVCALECQLGTYPLPQTWAVIL